MSLSDVPDFLGRWLCPDLQGGGRALLGRPLERDDETRLD
jgi:hypothetical protein